MRTTSLHYFLALLLFAASLPALAQYTAGTISFAGASPTQQAALEATAKLHTAGFLKNNTAIRSANNTSASYKAIRDPAVHTVEVTISFVSGITGVKE